MKIFGDISLLQNPKILDRLTEATFASAVFFTLMQDRNIIADYGLHTLIPYISGRRFGWKGAVIGSIVNLIHEVLQGRVIPGDVDTNDVVVGALFSVLSLIANEYEKRKATSLHS